VDKEGKYRMMKELTKNLVKIGNRINLKEHLFDFNDPRLTPVKVYLSIFSRILKVEDNGLSEII